MTQIYIDSIHGTPENQQTSTCFCLASSFFRTYIIMKKILILLLLATTTLLSGCALGRRTVDLNIPQLTPASANRGAVHIASVEDKRVFENNPRTPFTPSIDGDATAMTPDQQNKMIGRKRNIYGMALGDIALPENETVTQKVLALVESALKQRGYQITPDTSVPVTATVSVDEFWAWCTPGFGGGSFEARVTCTVVLTKAGSPVSVTIRGYGISKGHVASDANWQLPYERAFADFLENFSKELDKTPF